MVFSPVGLNEDAVDLLEIDGAGLVAHGFDEGTNGEIAGAAEDSVPGAHDESESFGSERVVAKAAAVELIEEEGFDGLGGKPWHEGGEGDAGFDFLVDRKAQGLEQRGLAKEQEVVSAGEVLKEQAEFSQTVGRHEVGIVDDGNKHFAGTVETEGMSHELAFALVVVTMEVDFKSRAEDAKRVVVGVKGAVDDGGHHAFGVMVEESGFEDAFAGTGFADNQAKAALLGMNKQDVKDVLLMREQGV